MPTASRCDVHDTVLTEQPVAAHRQQKAEIKAVHNNQYRYRSHKMEYSKATPEVDSPKPSTPHHAEAIPSILIAF
jgi:hypothetical protein